MEIIYAAFDESNHGRSVEVVAGVFSPLFSDALPEEMSGRSRMHDDRLYDFFKEDSSREWYIDAIPRGKLKNFRNPLIQVAPHLIRQYVNSHGGQYLFDILLDGDVRNHQKLYESIKEIPRAEIKSVVCFPKKRRSRGTYLYPKLLSAADGLAWHAYNDLYKEKSFMKRIGLDKKEVII